MTYFTIPDWDESAFLDQSRWMETDIQAIVGAINGSGVLNGCAVTAQGSPNMTVAVAAGEILSDGTKGFVVAGNVTVPAADGTNPRIDLVVASSAGVKSVTAGTAATPPKAPALPAGSVLLAGLYVPAGATSIAAGQITDKRIPVRPSFPEGRLVSSGIAQLSVPGVSFVSVGTAAATANYFRYFPMFVLTPITLDQLVCEITAAGAAGSTARMGIYHMDRDGTPGTLIVDSGAFATDTIGMKPQSISVQLQPGAYYLALATSGTPTFRAWRGTYPGIPILPAGGTISVVATIRATQTYGAFPSPGPAATAPAGGNQPNDYLVAVRLSAA